MRAGLPSVQIRKLLGRAARVAATLGGPPEERAKLVRQLVEKIIVDEKRLTIKGRRSALLGGDVLSSASEGARAAVRFGFNPKKSGPDHAVPVIFPARAESER